VNSTIAGKILLRSPIIANATLSITLFGLKLLLKQRAMRHQSFRDRLKERNFTAQIKVEDNSIGRYFTFSDGKIISKRGIHSNPDVCMTFRSAHLAVSP